jgi:hypothetical protein
VTSKWRAALVALVSSLSCACGESPGRGCLALADQTQQVSAELETTCLGAAERLPRTLRATVLRNLVVEKVDSPQLFLVSTSLRHGDWIITRLGIDFEVNRVGLPRRKAHLLSEEIIGPSKDLKPQDWAIGFLNIEGDASSIPSKEWIATAVDGYGIYLGRRNRLERWFDAL